MIETYAPVFIIEISGQQLPEDISRNIESFSYEDDEKKMDELKITIYDADLSFVDNPMLQEGKEIRARWGYLGNLSEIRTCTIKEISYIFGEDRVARIEISAYDKRHKLTGRAPRTCWSNVATANVVRDIAKKHHLTPVVDIPDDVIKEFVSQGGKNDMVFLNELADDLGCSIWVVNDELHFKPNILSEPVLKFRWGEDRDGYLQSLRITSKAEKGKGTGNATQMSGLDPLTKKPIKETVGAKPNGQSGETEMYSAETGERIRPDNNETGDTLPSKRKSNETPFKPQNDEVGRVVPTPAATKAQAAREGQGKVHSSSMKSIEVTATTIGLPYLKAKDTVLIENIGKKFSGKWRIKKVKHSISKDNYICELNLCKSDHETLGGRKAGAAPKTTKNSSNAASAGDVKNKGVEVYNANGPFVGRRNMGGAF